MRKPKLENNKFNPVEIGLKKDERGYNEVLYNLEKDGKIIGWLIYHAPSWLAYKAHQYKEGEEITGGLVFQGAIPSNSFGKELIQNLFFASRSL